MQQQFRTSIAQINRHFKALLERARGPQHWGRGRKLLLACALALCLGAPTLAVVQGTFSDVPPTAFYYNAVEAIYRAGITTGCATGLYCPDNAVTRGQMAVFMQRGFGRIYYARNTGVSLNRLAVQKVLAGITIDTTDSAPGQKVFVKLDATLTARSQTPDCSPCVIGYAINSTSLSGVGEFSLNHNGDVKSNSGAMTLGIEVPTGVKSEYELFVYLKLPVPYNGDVVVDGALSAITAPFGVVPSQ
jgi:hypothetical protein